MKCSRWLCGNVIRWCINKSFARNAKMRSLTFLLVYALLHQKSSLHFISSIFIEIKLINTGYPVVAVKVWDRSPMVYNIPFISVWNVDPLLSVGFPRCRYCSFFQIKTLDLLCDIQWEKSLTNLKPLLFQSYQNLILTFWYDFSSLSVCKHNQPQK